MNKNKVTLTVGNCIPKEKYEVCEQCKGLFEKSSMQEIKVSIQERKNNKSFKTIYKPSKFYCKEHRKPYNEETTTMSTLIDDNNKETAYKYFAFLRTVEVDGSGETWEVENLKRANARLMEDVKVLEKNTSLFYKLFHNL